MTHIVTIILFYLISCVSCYMSASLNLNSLNQTRRSLSAKSRKEIDSVIYDTKLYKKYSIFWPYVLYMIIKNNNEKK
jgi:hypothetical protein